MTTYRVPVSDLLLLEPGQLDAIPGFRLVSKDGPWLAHPDITICTFEDDNALPEFEGKFVQPVFMTRLDGSPVIVERHILEG